jgi:DNA-binding transcriptional regulator GbsR (MarR family)
VSNPDQDSPFRRLVLADLRQEISDLREPQRLSRWRQELSAVVREMEEQFAIRGADLAALRARCFANGDKEAYFAAEAEHLNWKARATGFKRHVVDRLQEVNALMKENNVAHSHDLSDRKYRALRLAITVHRSTVEAEYEPTAADLLLWEALEDIDTEIDVREGVNA